MNTTKLFYLLLLLAGLVSLFFFFTKPLWMEPDTTAFYNRACLGGADFETPILPRIIFGLLPCSIIAWKVFQLFLILCSTSAIYYFCKKNLKDPEWFWFSFWSYFLLIFLLNMEDDQIAFPLIIALSGWLLFNPTWKKRILYLLSIGFLWYFLWNGSFVPMLLILVWTIEPLLAILFSSSIFGYQLIINHMIGFADPGGTSETILGAGFLSNDIPLLIFLFAKDKKKKILENKKLFSLFMGFNILGFIYPKLSYYSIVPFLLLVEKLFPEEDRKTLLILGGVIIFFLAPALILHNAVPTPKMLTIIDQGVLKQKNGFPVYTEWWLGRWFYYEGGIPSDQGGNHGFQRINLPDFYWLGLPRTGCTTLKVANPLYYQECKDQNGSNLSKQSFVNQPTT